MRDGLAHQLVVGLDADDTLWDNESAFAITEAKFRDLAEPWIDGAAADRALLEVERANIERYGYGVKSFVLSMIESITAISNGEVTVTQLNEIIDWGKDLLGMAPVLLDDVQSTVEDLVATHRVLIITKGDLHHQLARLRASGLDTTVDDVEVVAEKDPATYAAVLTRHGIAAQDFVMVGNSMKSDVLPVLELGAAAIHIPFHVTWALEVHDEPVDHPRLVTADTFAEVPALIRQLESNQ